MTRKQIDAARERRLWFTQIMVPTASMAVTVLSIPEVRYAVAAKCAQVKTEIEYETENLKKKFQKH